MSRRSGASGAAGGAGPIARAAPLATGQSRAALRRRAPAAEIVRRWRMLTGGGGAPTLVACSGGADSTAVLLALRSATDGLVVGHIVHELRPREEELADRDAVRSMASSLGLAFAEAEIAPAAGENMEASARRLRYAALARLAQAQGCGFVATGHHADDQLESIVMALLRGAGPEGLSGAAPARRLTPEVTLVRPALRVTRADCRALCAFAGVEWRHDRANDDNSRARNALRMGPLADLAARRPGAARRASEAADLLRDAAGLIRDRAREVFGDADRWPRAALRLERDIVLGAGLRAAAMRLSGTHRGRDRVGARAVAGVLRAIRDDHTEPREFRWALGAGVTIVVVAREVSVSPALSALPRRSARRPPAS